VSRIGAGDRLRSEFLTHTPQASKFPESLEGKILYYVDQLDVIAIHKDRWKKELIVKR
jgi:hypothetical protein